MKYSFSIKVGTRTDDSGLISLTNKHPFELKTTMFGESIETVWKNLGTFVNRVKVADSVSALSIPGVPQRIESDFENKIKIGFSFGEASFGEFYTLAKYDGNALSELDGKTLKEMDSNIEEG